MWKEGPHCQKLQSAGKRPRGPLPFPSREGSPFIEGDACIIEYTPAISTTIRRNAAYITGNINGHRTDILLDSGASCSVVCSHYIPPADIQPITSITLLNADGSSLSPVGTTTAQVALNGLDTHHNFVVVNDLSTPVILGCDFLLKHGVLLDFGKSTFTARIPVSSQEGSTCRWSI